jgi:hypothetical protein
VGSCECGDESLGSGTMELVSVCIINNITEFGFIHTEINGISVHKLKSLHTTHARRERYICHLLFSLRNIKWLFLG